VEQKAAIHKLRFATATLLASVVLLTIFGLVMLYSTTSATSHQHFLLKQSVWIFLGMVLAAVICVVDYRRIGAASKWVLLLVALPLVYLATAHVLYRCGYDWITELPFVASINGAFRWLRVGNFTLQPSEFAKPALIIFLAHYYGTNPRNVLSFIKGVWRPVLVVGMIVILVLLGGSLSVTMITGMVVMAVMFIAGVRLRYLLLLISIGILSIVILLFVSIRVGDGERVSRLTSFRHPEATAKSTGYQLLMSQYALGSGHWTGVGFNESRLKERYLPESHTDFILAIVGEELGFTAVAGVMLMYLLILGAALTVSTNALDREGMLLTAGVGLSIGLHALIHAAVVSGAGPTTGITAPLISYGGSSMLTTWIGVGLLVSVIRTTIANSDADEEAASRQRTSSFLAKDTQPLTLRS
jgi:cell division protein FtsW